MSTETTEAPVAPKKAWRNMNSAERKAEKAARDAISQRAGTSATATAADIDAKDAEIAALRAQLAAVPKPVDVSKLPAEETWYEFTYTKRDPDSGALVGDKIALGDPKWTAILADPHLVQWGTAVIADLTYGPGGDVIERKPRGYREKSPQAAHTRLQNHAAGKGWVERVS